MRRRSFRFRLALISMGLSGCVLLVFGLVAWWALSQSQLRALDQELTNFGQRFASRSGAKVSGERQEETLAGMLGAEVARYRFFTIRDLRDTVLFGSSRWPEGLDSSRFSAGAEVLHPQPEFITQTPKPGEDRSDRELRDVYEPRFYTVLESGRRYRIGVFRNANVILTLGADLDQFSQGVIQLRNAFLIALPGALAMIALGAWWLGKKALRPIRALENDMNRLSASVLDQRLEAGNADVEFARIIETYNRMLERLERSFHQANRFSADASHELKTPLAIMRGTLERGLVRCQSEEDAQDVFAELLEQTGRQGAILESLLLLSRADAGRMEISTEPIDLSAMLETWLEDASLLAEARGITIESEIMPGILLEGDPVLLQRVAHNLFSNAVRYNREGGRIESRLVRAESGLEWTIANTGESIAEEDRERIFDRFERAQSPGFTHGESSGLGLSLVREIVAAHGGQVAAEESDCGMTVFRVRLPV